MSRSQIDVVMRHVDKLKASASLTALAPNAAPFAEAIMAQLVDLENRIDALQRAVDAMRGAPIL